MLFEMIMKGSIKVEERMKNNIIEKYILNAFENNKNHVEIVINNIKKYAEVTEDKQLIYLLAKAAFKKSYEMFENHFKYMIEDEGFKIFISSDKEFKLYHIKKQLQKQNLNFMSEKELNELVESFYKQNIDITDVLHICTTNYEAYGKLYEVVLKSINS
jgi:hypothetical protein